VKRAWSRKNLWERAPRPVRAVCGLVAGRLPLGWLLGSRYRAWARLLAAADRWSAETARAYQLERLRELCQTAFHSPYYRRLFHQCGFQPGDLRAPEDLDQLPTLDAETVRSELRDLCTVDPETANVDYVTTGGTGGKPLGFYAPAGRSAAEFAHLVTGWMRVGYWPGMPVAVFRGRTTPPDRRGLRHEHDPLLRHHYYSTFHMTDRTMQRYLEHVGTLGPCFLHVYPSAIDELARAVRRGGVRPPENVLGILAESEIVYPEQRRVVEETFGCRYFSSYGMSEKVALAAECERSDCYHVWPTYGYCELLNQDGRRVTTPGEPGEIVATGFLNHVMPFIRYRTGDHALYAGERCPACGREQLLLRDVRGHRTQEALIARDGSRISWTALNMHDDTFQNVLRVQFVQDRPGEAELLLVPAPGFGDADRRRIGSRLARKLDGQVTVRLSLCDQTRLSARGKAIYVDQRILEAARVTAPDAAPRRCPTAPCAAAPRA
jgi:phenylacetate-CoA ligase